MNAVFLDTATLGDDLDWSRLADSADAWRWFEATAPDQAALRLADAEIVVTNKVVLDRALIAGAPRLRLIGVAATGMNNIDRDAAAEHGVAVVNITGYATAAVSQHVMALMLAFATRWPDYARAVERGDWSAQPFFCLLEYPIVELTGRTLGIIGHGDLGAGVARLAEAFGMQVLIAEHRGAAHIRAGRTPFETVLAAADVLSLHCPLTPDTEGLIDAEALARMPDHALLINTARGEIVDDQALLAALREKRLGGAALDVFDREPPPADHPLLDTGLDNLVITPHVAWASGTARQRILDGLATQIAAFGEDAVG